MRGCIPLLPLVACFLLLCASGDADESPEAAPQDELKVARQRFEEQVNTAVKSIRDRHIAQLEGLQRALKRRGEIEAAAEVQAEIEWLKASTKPFRSNPLEGEWEIKYGNRSTRTYRVHPHGKVDFGDREGQLQIQGNDTLLDFGDGKLERLSFKLVVEHYNPASRYPIQAPSTLGTGTRAPETLESDEEP